MDEKHLDNSVEKDRNYESVAHPTAPTGSKPSVNYQSTRITEEDRQNTC